MQSPEQSRVYITGMGVISGIGKNVEENFNSIKAGRSGIGKIKYLNTVHKEKFLVSEVAFSNEELILGLGLDKDEEYPRTTLLALWAAREAMEDAGFESDSAIRTGIIVGTTVGGMDVAENHYKQQGGNPKFIISSQSKGYTAEMIAELYGIYDFVTTITTACSSSANAIALGADLIKSKRLDRVIVGGADSLCKYTLNGFNTLMILSEQPCTPFDDNRSGLNLGEGAGFLVLESSDQVRKKNKHTYAMVSGYANNNDAFHQTATSDTGEGPYLCMKGAMEMAGINPLEIDYINAHGTGTPNNDVTESAAIQRIFGRQYPPFSSLKPYIGHTLGAAGSVEAIFSVLSIQNQMIYKNLNFKTPIHGVDIVPVTESKPEKVVHVMSNSFGFGGNDTSVILSQTNSN
ncbi:beta-ketoacyl-[acyl-carrier-protein] synthase family protein [Plebeiibacterium marinum]|uniref:Beta-ketoacyl-[acyl-carrier-protein] synthase family protein n=1 Tax=Plebeiibacterium marinum TaxID=2992111 RepID=A0AAE3SJI8_9BACT|nr:beta-ketoacyl-[acyl-carrier-protein] synthase family protein [Plebeiobacterium marinum]MCW3805790.1 beta-ketoacyl-[acyl-carrier-protein] synthase family protein [Plebeiobacterium marinum]